MAIGQDATFSYEELGYNNRLQATDGLANRNDDFVTSTQFEANNDRNSISTYNVRNLNFSVMQGGTATLGGTANGSGYLSIKNSGGTEIVKGDSTGLTVTGGNILVQNTDGSTVFDASGVVSTNNFLFNTYSDSSTWTTAGQGSGTWVNVGSTNQQIVLSRTTNLFLIASMGATVSNGSAVGAVGMMVNGTVLSGFARNIIDVWSNPLTLNSVIQLAAGTHNFSVAVYGNVGHDVEIDHISKTYLSLGN